MVISTLYNDSILIIASYILYFKFCSPLYTIFILGFLILWGNCGIILMMKKGYFIVFEGPDGSGKSTVSQAVYQNLVGDFEGVILTREPGGSRIAEDIRDIILSPKNVEMDARTEALLYAASRRQHLVEVILPAVKAGKIVICDRFVDSSLAYQSYGRQLALKDVVAINDFAIEGCYPDLTIFLDIPADVGLARLVHRSNKDRLDIEGLDFHQRAFVGYQEILEKATRPYVVVDAAMAIEEVVRKSLKVILEFINE